MSRKEKKLESIAADLVIGNIDDLPALANIHEKYIQLDKLIGNESSLASLAVRACADLIEKIILKEVEDQAGSFSILVKSIPLLQSLLSGKATESEIEFPSGLGLKSNLSKDQTDSTEKPQANESLDSDENDNEYSINPLESDGGLIAEFITEAREHCASAEQILMDLETGENDESSINDLFRSFHTIKGAAGFLDLKPILSLAHESETLLDMARKGTLEIEGAVADIVYDLIDALRQLLQGVEDALNTGTAFDGGPITTSVLERLHKILEDPSQLTDFESGNRVGDHLIKTGVVSRDQIESALTKRENPDEKLGETLIKQKIVPAKVVGQALRQQQKSKQENAFGRVVKEMVKIDTERLDRMVDTIGELVIAESMVSQDDEILGRASHQVSRNIAHLNKITRELQEMGMSMRLLPVRGVFQKLARAVRDLTRKSGKMVDLQLIGEETEVDRSIIELVGDPLMHMIRNALDHGIESPSDRKKSNKPETGTVILRAYHEGGKVHFDIEDDGRGLDKKKLLAKGKERNLLDPSKEPTDGDIYRLIFHPGFSTASVVTDVSGRGVGMDVVKRNIDAMRGHLDIESKPGRGTKFSMKLPLTLAIIEGMLVSISNEKYIIPTLSIVESLSLSPDMIILVSGKNEMINLRGNMLPLLRIKRIFGLPEDGGPDSDGTVVVVEDGPRKLGIVVDRLLGQRQTVIKSLGNAFSEQKWISGGAILSDGHIGLIIDIGGVLRLADLLGDKNFASKKERWNIKPIESDSDFDPVPEQLDAD